jgi:4-hydroxy-tetrahydrodipicolinate synthase
MAQFAGVWVAVCTPFTDGGDVDPIALRRHVDWLIDAGVDGLVPTGSCGEYGVLTPEERRLVVETVAETSRRRGVPVMVGVAAPATRDAVGWARHAKEVGAAGVMALPPVLYRARWEEVRAHYEALNRVGIPIVVYNNPSDTGFDITPEHLHELNRLENIAAVKEFSQDIRRVTAIQEATTLQVIAGTDDLLLESLIAGATGWIAGMANILPRASVRLYRTYQAGDLQEAWRLYRRLLPLLRWDSTPRLVQAIKTGLRLRQRPVGETRPPRLALTADEEAMLRETLAGLADLEDGSV